MPRSSLPGVWWTTRRTIHSGLPSVTKLFFQLTKAVPCEWTLLRVCCGRLYAVACGLEFGFYPSQRWRDPLCLQFVALGCADTITPKRQDEKTLNRVFESKT